MTKVGIVYGWGEGPAHGRKLRAQLQKENFANTNELETADILIAHSGGGLVLPPVNVAKLIVLVGFPLWPQKHPVLSAGQKFGDDVRGRGGKWIARNLYILFYAFVQPRRLVQIWRAWKGGNFVLPQSPKFLLIRNQNDHFVHPTEIIKLGEGRGWQVETMAGGHDDIWQNPEPYVKLIKQHYGLLAQANHR